jgi:hypothetical protein
VVTDERGVGVKAMDKKWVKARQLLFALIEEASKSQLLDYKELERTRGFFVHIQ